MQAKKSSSSHPARRHKISPQKRVPAADKSKPFPIVGIGASAGGLKAFEQFFANLPADSGAAFVLVPHLDPTHVSMLPDLLRKYTKMPVVQAENGMKILPNRVHVMAPNSEMIVTRATLLLKKPTEPRGLRLPIDTFLRSLAEDQKQKAVCIILSGNGSDGTLGLRAIKGNLGLAIAQEPSSAEYDSMPRSAIATGMVDYVLPPEKMAARLVSYLRRVEPPHVSVAGGSSEKAPESLQRIFQLLRSRTSHDFSCYKTNTLCRRIERRMSVHEIESLADYVDYLERNPQEVVTLFKELLIGVTNFFRDPDAFAQLSSRLRSEVLADKPKDYAVRVWVPGCSSGEEVYSLAIILQECKDALKKTWKIQIFGTDIDADAIDTARAGLYPASIVTDIPAERLKRYFVAEGNAYRVKKEIREMAVFAIQDLLKDPPFTKLDLLSCRNLLIYLDGEVQKKLLPLFHYALKPDGMLFLGSSESINAFADLFSVVDKKWKIFRRRASSFAADAIVQFPTGVPRAETAKPAPRGQNPAGQTKNLAEVAQRLLVGQYAPPTVFVDSAGEIFYTHGRTGKYLELAPGQANLNVLEMAREGIRHELAAAIRKARLQRRNVTLEALQVKSNGGSVWLNMTVTPVRLGEGVGELFMVVFEDVEPKQAKTGKTGKAVVSARAARRIAQLEQEIGQSQEHLQTTVEELETSNEELKSSNEELQSTNEELQSTNEELETSKEELQSLNEEMVTVNAELQGKIDELSHSNDDMKNLLDSTKIATIFLDSDLCIKRFTSEATKVINLIPGDVGRPIGHIVSNLERDSLAADARRVIDSLVPKERQVRTKDGCWYLNRIIPYRTLDNVIDGVVATFIDISEQKIVEAAISDRNLAEGIVETVREPLMVLDQNLKVVAANSAFCSLFQVIADRAVGHGFFALEDGQWNIAPLRELLEKVLPQNSQINEFIVDHNFLKVGHKKLSLNARRVYREGVGTETILVTFRDVTDGG